MSLSRRALLGAAALLFGTTACSASAVDRVTGAPPAPPDPDDPLYGFFERLRAAPQGWSLHLDDGRGGVVEHRADEISPYASASTVVHLATYARIVADGFPADVPVPVAEWERWYVPGTDGGNHQRALAAVGATPESTVTWDDVVAAMLHHGDEAAADLLRETVGDGPLSEAAAAGGMAGYELPCFAGEVLRSWSAPVDPATRRADALAAGQEYAASPQRRAEVAERMAAPSRETLGALADPGYWAGSPGGTARGLASMYRACATGDLGVPGAGEIVRGQLERLPIGKLPEGVAAVGAIDGSRPGVLAAGLYQRHDDGAVATAALLLTGAVLDPDGEDARSGVAVAAPLQALRSPQVWERFTGIAR
ncbi:serine hydrolase [Pseudonocardia sp. NPDC049635]|uniref:serine hydrolase n=1 Tax=Pseudonocardia sp. NPDC049635 TaxID=3155506 RepID=UPI0033EBD868